MSEGDGEGIISMRTSPLGLPADIQQKTASAVRQLRKALGETQEQFARRMGTTVRTIARWEGPRPPTGQALIRLEHMAATNGAVEAAAVFRVALNDAMGRRLSQASIYRTDEERDLCQALLAILREEKHKRRRAVVRRYLQPALDELQEQDLARKHAEDSEAALHLLQGGMDVPEVARRLGMKRQQVEFLSEELKRGTARKRAAQSSDIPFTREAAPSALR